MLGARNAVVFAVIAGAVLLAARVPVRGDDDELNRKLDALAQRLDKIENALGIRAGGAARLPISDRIDALKKGLGDLSRAAGKPTWSSPDNNLRDLTRSIQEGQQQRADLANRLGRLEHSSRDISDCARELRSIRTMVDNVRSDLRSLDNRVQRLESRP